MNAVSYQNIPPSISWRTHQLYFPWLLYTPAACGVCNLPHTALVTSSQISCFRIVGKLSFLFALRSWGWGFCTKSRGLSTLRHAHRVTLAADLYRGSEFNSKVKTLNVKKKSKRCLKGL